MNEGSSEGQRDDEEGAPCSIATEVSSTDHWTQRAAWMQYELRKRGYTQAAFAKVVGVSHSTLNNVLHGRAKSRRVADRIASLLGQPVQELFPGQYAYRPRRRPSG